MDAPIKQYMLKELATLYNVHKSTMLRYIRSVPGIDMANRVGKFFTIKQVQQIFTHLGTPDISPINKSHEQNSSL